ncbi:MAG: M48 family metallopeptidase [Chlamydiia bacterium]|nr:M48 family metallopeptidase [Chlamydiia bacterium]
MKRLRFPFLITILCGILFTVIVIAKQKVSVPFTGTLSPFFQELGKPIKSIDRVVSSILPINEIDEKALGEELKSRFRNQYDARDSKSTHYLNALVKDLTKTSKKPFDYEVYLLFGSPNAFALPGGIICITDSLMDTLKTEGELVAILGHEIGHIEKGHCFDLYRGKMLKKTMETLSIAIFASEIFQSIASITFSKSQESEADDYGFQLLVENGYSPFSLSSSFQHLIEIHPTKTAPNPIVDFLHSHPYLEIRQQQSQEKAIKWFNQNPKANPYIGAKNLKEKIPRCECAFLEEYQKAES